MFIVETWFLPQRLKRGVNISCLPDECFPHVVWRTLPVFQNRRAGRKFLDVNRENLQADYPSVFGPGVKEVKTSLSISLKAS